MSSPSPEKFVEEVRAKRAKYIELAQREEAFARRNPEAYKRKVALLAYLGYGYIFVILCVLILVLVVGVGVVVLTGKGGFIGIKLLFLLVPLIWVVARSLYVKLDPPQGYEVSRIDAPELYRAIDGIRKKLGTIPIDKVILDTDVNAYAAQYPKYGMFGPTKNYLVLGFPLLLVLKPEEAKSVIAHEFGHFSGQHGKFSAWIYRLNRTWAMIQANLQQNGSTWLFQRFFDWFEPKFDATSFALRRQNEFEADAAAVQIAGKEAAAKALMRFPVVGPHIQEAFWDPLFLRARTEPSPPKNALALLPDVAKKNFSLDDVEKKVERELSEKTDYSDTHPALRERLDAMGIGTEDIPRLIAEVAEGASTSAAESFFGEKLSLIVARVNETQLKGMEGWWANYHKEFQVLLERKAVLTSLGEERELSEDEEVELAILTRRVETDEAALAQVAHARRRFPENPTLLAAEGDLRLEKDDPAGIALLERAVELKPDLAAEALTRIQAYYRRIGEDEKAAEYEDKSLDARIIDAYAEQQAQRILLADDFEPHDLAGTQLSTLQAELAKCGNLKEAYLVKKRVQAQGDRSFYVLLVVPITTIKIQDTNAKLLKEISEFVHADERCTIIAPPDYKPWQKRFKAVSNALVYSRK